MTTQAAERRRVGGADIAIMILGAVLAGAACFAGLAFSPIIATPAAVTLAVAAVVIATRPSVGRGPGRSALFGVAAGTALVLAFYWISALIHME